MTPKRIQRQRTKGWKMPPNTVYVGRPTKWGNPYAPNVDFSDPDGPVFGDDFPCGVNVVCSQEECVDLYRCYAVGSWLHDKKWCEELRGKNLACWCPLDQPCHADILLELANQE